MLLAVFSVRSFALFALSTLDNGPSKHDYSMNKLYLHKC